MSSRRKRFFWSKEELVNSPSYRDGYSSKIEQRYRVECAELIERVGAMYKISIFLINRAIIYMQRFYQLHSHAHFDRYSISAASFYLALKFSSNHKLGICPPSLVMQAFNYVRNKYVTPDISEEMIDQQTKAMCCNEVFMLVHTFNFDVYFDDPYTHVQSICKSMPTTRLIKLRASYLAFTVVSRTNMCLHHPAQGIACFCFYLAYIWTGNRISMPRMASRWYNYVFKHISVDVLNQMLREFTDMYKAYSKYIPKCVFAAVDHLVKCSRQRTRTAKSLASQLNLANIKIIRILSKRRKAIRDAHIARANVLRQNLPNRLSPIPPNNPNDSPLNLNLNVRISVYKPNPFHDPHEFPHIGLSQNWCGSEGANISKSPTNLSDPRRASKFKNIFIVTNESSFCTNFHFT